MNRWEKEVQQSLLDSEEAALKELEAQYARALRDINEKVKGFQAGIDLLDQALSQDGLDDAARVRLQSQKRSKVYQQQYQKALQGQVSGILDKLHGDNYATIEGYLKGCYDDGYIGTMYDIAKQGVPVIAPIDQAAAVKAILTDSKVSNGLYNALGVDVAKLKKTITQEISRGIASSLPYREIARNIGNVSGAPLSRAKTIARTEGHRIQQMSTVDAQQAAKAKGADVLKQWDATLDGRTRESHRRVDGEIRELDEKFSNGLMFPGDPNGSAAEVVNCRCTSNTRARWALGEEELQTLKDRAEFFGLDKTKNFEEYKEKYLTASKKVASQATKAVANPDKSSNINNIELDLDNFSDAFTGKTAEKKNTQMLINYVNSLPNADQRTLELYNSIGKMDKFSENGISFSITHTKNHAVTASYRVSSGEIVEVKLNVPKLSGSNLAGQVGTTLHEQMHLIDLMLRDDPTKYGRYFSASNQALQEIVQKSSGTIGNDVLELFKKFNEENKTLRATLQAEYDNAIDALKQQFLPNGVFGAGANYKSYKKAADKAWKDIMETKYDYESRNLLGGGICDLQDIYDALSGGMYRDNGTVLYGHGSRYYSSVDSRIDEIIANYGALSVTRPDLIDMLREDDPDLVSALEETIDEMRKKVATIVRRKKENN